MSCYVLEVYFLKSTTLDIYILVPMATVLLKSPLIE